MFRAIVKLQWAFFQPIREKNGHTKINISYSSFVLSSTSHFLSHTLIIIHSSIEKRSCTQQAVSIPSDTGGRDPHSCGSCDAWHIAQQPTLPSHHRHDHTVCSCAVHTHLDSHCLRYLQQVMAYQFLTNVGPLDITQSF